MNTLAVCALLIGADPEPPRFPRAEVTIPKLAEATNAAVVAISADGALAAGGFGRSEDCQVAVFDRKSGEEIYRARQRGPYLTSMAFSRDARYLAVSSYMFATDASAAYWDVYLIDLKAKKVIKSWDAKWFAFSPTSDHLYLTAPEHIIVIELPGLKPVQTLPVPDAYRLAVSPDGKAVAAIHGGLLGDQTLASGFLSFVDVGTRRVTLEYSGKELEKATALAYSPDGSRVATGYEQGVARVWPAVKAGKPRVLRVETPFHVLPLWFDKNILGLVTQRRLFRVNNAPGVQTRWADLYRHDLAAEQPEPTRWHFEWAMDTDSGNANSVRYAVSADGQRLVAGCNGLTIFNLITRKTERTFLFLGPLDR